MTTTQRSPRLTAEDIRLINSRAVPCDGCCRMHWDAYRTGRCASCSTIEEMQHALDEGWAR